MATKLDLYKTHKADYVTPRAPVLLTIKPETYLAVEGRGAPGGEVFVARLGGLYAVAFTMKHKFAGRDYAVCKLEGLWWGSKEIADFINKPRDTWNWKLLIRTPDFIKRGDVRSTIDSLLKKGKPSDVAEVRLEKLAEGR